MKNYYSRYTKAFISVAVLVVLLGIGKFTGCTDEKHIPDTDTSGIELSEVDSGSIISDNTAVSSSSVSVSDNGNTLSYNGIAIPGFTGSPSVEINGNKPFFTDEELSETAAYENYSELDSLGRCGTATALIDKSLMPTEPRGEIGMIKPTGWHTVKYVNVDGHYLYNRCHLIAYELTGENANEKNLITGTRYLNIEGMLPYENKVADYIRTTGNQVLYRVTPVFVGDELVARGVVMEGQSIGNDDISFCIFCYNVQPDVTIDYSTGESEGEIYE